MTTYRSGFEKKIAEKLEQLGVSFEYESEQLKYIVPETTHTYTPDWKIGNTLYESKGYWPSRERMKLLRVKKSNPDVEIRIIFQNADNKISKGSKTTYGVWATKNGFEWADWRKGIPRHWLKEMKHSE